MARRATRLSPRKRPRQARAQATVDAILDAAAYILRRGTFEAMTTNAIAARAGVNIASLYQYFPNKHAIVAALQRRHVEQTRAAMLPVLAKPRRGTTAQVRALVEAMAAMHAVDPVLHARLTALAPQLGLQAIDTDTDRAIADASAAWVRAMRDRLPDPELALWVAHTAVHAVFHLAFVERPGLAASPALVDELVRLAAPYLAPKPRRATRGGRARRAGS